MKPTVPTAALILFLAAAPAGAQPQPGKAPHAALLDRQGKQIGTVVVDPSPNGVLISVVAEGLPPGEHGFHIHETGTCDAAAGFSSAGGHFAPRGKQHGLMSAGGPHGGDMPNQFVTEDGRLRTHVFNGNVTLGGGEGSLADGDGSALVIHAGTDDYKSQPSGAAGDRLACAVLVPGAAG